MKQLFASLAVVGFTVVMFAGCGPDALDAATDTIDQHRDGLMACTANAVGSGQIGSTNISLPDTANFTVSAIVANGTSTLTVTGYNTSTGAVTTNVMTLGNGITATGSFGNAGNVAEITAVQLTGNTAIFTGRQKVGTSWTPINGTITFTNMRFDGAVTSGYLRIIQLQASPGYFGGLMLSQTSPTVSATSFGGRYASTACTGISVAESGSTGTITLSATAPGATTVTYVIDGTRNVVSNTAPFTTTFNSQVLANGSHTLYGFASDETGNRYLTSTTSFTTANDKTGPTVTAAESGTTGTIAFSATATDPAGVSKVEFLVDGTVRGTLTAAPYTMTYDSRLLTNATHTLVARATDGLGNVSSSTGVSFTTSNDFTAPTTTFSVTGTQGTITLNATATDAAGVAHVDFYVVSGSLSLSIGSLTAAPYTMQFDSRVLASASATFYAYAYDAYANKATVTQVVAINNTTVVDNDGTSKPNNTIAGAQALGAITKAAGLMTSTDVDHYSVVVAAGRTLVVRTTPQNNTSIGVDLAVTNAAGTVLASAATVNSAYETISLANTTGASVTWYIKVVPQPGYTGNTSYFVLADR